jgi:hypothetical protein
MAPTAIRRHLRRRRLRVALCGLDTYHTRHQGHQWPPAAPAPSLTLSSRPADQASMAEPLTSLSRSPTTKPRLSISWWRRVQRRAEGRKRRCPQKRSTIATRLRPPLACLRQRWSQARGGAGSGTASHTSGLAAELLASVACYASSSSTDRKSSQLLMLEVYLKAVQPRR